MSNAMLERAWAGGFFDGEGTVSWYIKNKTIRKCLRVSNTDWEMIQKFVDIFPGCNISLSKIKNSQRWIALATASGDYAEEVAEALIPYCTNTKKRQLELFIEGCNVCVREPGMFVGDEELALRQHYAEEIKKCKKYRPELEAANM